VKHVDPNEVLAAASPAPARRFTAEEDAVIRAAVGRETAVKVAAQLGRMVCVVRKRAQALGCPFPRQSGRHLVRRVLPAGARREQALDAGGAGKGVEYLAVRHGQCRWPLWRDGQGVTEWRYCGAPRLEKRGCSYCDSHAALAFRAEAA